MSAAPSLGAPIYQRVEGVDVRSLPLTPEQAFVLSRVDGKATARTIASETGLTPEHTRGHLECLEKLGAVRRRGAATAKPSAGRGRSSPGAPPTEADPAEVALIERHRSELDPGLDIALALQAKIVELSSRLGELDHFTVLGIDRRAERAAVKRAYFSMVGDFHPDTYFGKKVGGFTKRMEKIFQRLTEAHDILSNPKTREEYESYLIALGRTKGLDEIASAPPPSVEDLERLLEQAEHALRKAEPPPPPRPAPKAPSVPERPVPRRNVEMVDDPAARRQALARKLGLPGANLPPGDPREPTTAEDDNPAARRTAAVKDLHQRYQHRKKALREQRVERFAGAAEEALAAGNAVSALNTLKIAQTISGGDIKVVARLAELEKQLGATVADSYLERARYEETNGHYEEAARSYTRCARAQPSADVFRSAAECYLKAGVELRLAGDLAREAVQIAPDRVDLRMTLAKIYEAAGMQKSACRELERALEITPDSDRIKQWLKRLERGGV